MVGNSLAASAATAAFAGVALLVLAAPFELTSPLLRLPRQSVSSLEAAVMLACACWAGALVWTRTLPRWQTPLTSPWALLLAVMLVSALLSPVSRVNALHFTGRMTAALAIFLLTVNGVVSRARMRAVVVLMIAAAIVVSVAAFLEYLRVPAVLDALKAFRPGITVVGAQLRAGGTLQYPTIASMYLEIVFACGLGVLLAAFDAGERGRVVLLFAALVAIAEAITLTFTRAGLITMAASLGCVAVVRRRAGGSVQGMALVGALAAVVIALFATSRSAESLWLRATSEGQEAWYRATVAAPSSLRLATGRTATLTVNVTNTGRLVWDSSAETPIYFSYHWLPIDGDRFVTFEGARTPFPNPVAPGATIALDARVRAPDRPGRYRLEWDVVQEGRLWFSTEPGASRMFAVADVSGVASDDPADRPMAPPKPTERPGRMVLWRAAGRMFAEHPLLGVGADNFRLAYGPYAGVRLADSRLHSNDMYVEILAGTGLAGGAAFAWLLWRAGLAFARAARVDAGIAAAGLAIAVHGVVDSFLSFASTYVVFAITLGLAVASSRATETEMETEPDAYRL